MSDFANGRIYIIRSNKTDQVYIGSTTQKLSQRMGQHRSDFKCNKGVTSSELIKHGDAYIELIEKFPCEDREELHKREGEVMRATENTVNKQLAGRTLKQYRKDNKDKIKQYCDDNKDKTKQYNKQYCDDNKDKLSIQHKQYYDDNKDKYKQYRDDNKDKMKQYRKDNKDKYKHYQLNRKNKTTYCSLCDKHLKLQSLVYHKRSKKHRNELFILELAGEL